MNLIQAFGTKCEHKIRRPHWKNGISIHKSGIYFCWQDGAGYNLHPEDVEANDWERVPELPELPDQHEWLKVGDVKPVGYQERLGTFWHPCNSRCVGDTVTFENAYCAPIKGTWAYASAHLDAGEKVRCACWSSHKWIKKSKAYVGSYEREDRMLWAPSNPHKTATDWEIYAEPIEGSLEWAKAQMADGKKVTWRTLYDDSCAFAFKSSKHDSGYEYGPGGGICDIDIWEGPFSIYVDPKPTQAELDAAAKSLLEAVDSDMHVIEQRLKAYRELKAKAEA